MAQRPHSPFKPLWVLFIILVGVSAVTIASKLMRAKDIVPWRTNFAAAREEARRDSKPVLLYFTASWCPPCQEMKHVTWSDSVVESKLRNYVPVKIDIDADSATAIQFEVNPIPSFVLLDKDGNVVKRTDGFMEPMQFLAWLEG
jgi:thiol:disulfide interchange protein